MALSIAGVVARRGTSSKLKIARFSTTSKIPVAIAQIPAAIPAACRHPPRRKHQRAAGQQQRRVRGDESVVYVLLDAHHFAIRTGSVAEDPIDLFDAPDELERQL
jgi:hypothetical protein